jgi:Ca2+:H+ antiporter
MATAKRMPWWAWAWPSLAWLVLAIAALVGMDNVLAAGAGTGLILTVFAAVYHAEVVAHRVGEPFGTLVLAVAVTVIEVALIVSVMIGSAADKSGLARDTVFAAVMLICNGLVGLCLVVGGVRHYEQGFQALGASAALAVLAALVTLTLILPNFTITTPGPLYATPQLIFVGVVSLVLYGAFVFVQTVRHRGYFLTDSEEDEAHGAPPSGPIALLSLTLLIISLVAVVALAKALTPMVETTIDRFGAPKAVVGVIIATLVLLPESLAALRAARLNRLQTSMNLALGSALACIGLTIPTVSFVSIAMAQPLALGLGAREEVLLGVTLLISVLTLGTGRTTVLQGVVHLVILATFLFFTVVP